MILENLIVQLAVALLIVYLSEEVLSTFLPRTPLRVIHIVKIATAAVVFVYFFLTMTGHTHLGRLIKMGGL